MARTQRTVYRKSAIYNQSLASDIGSCGKAEEDNRGSHLLCRGHASQWRARQDDAQPRWVSKHRRSKRRVCVPRSDAVHADAFSTPLAREAASKLHKRTLGGGVDGAAGDGNHAGDRRVEHDAGLRRQQRLQLLAHCAGTTSREQHTAQELSEGDAQL